MPRLFMLLIGCLPPGRKIEQHDIFFGIGEDIREVVLAAIESWPEAKNTFHVDAWREVNTVGEYRVRVSDSDTSPNRLKLFFINLGGYKNDEFEEFHYRVLIVAADIDEAIRLSKQTAFFKHTGFPGATAHVDDKYGIGVDEVFEVKDILPADQKLSFQLLIEPVSETCEPDALHLGYFKPSKIESWAPPRKSFE